jgi:hypothetical protein
MKVFNGDRVACISCTINASNILPYLPQPTPSHEISTREQDLAAAQSTQVTCSSPVFSPCYLLPDMTALRNKHIIYKNITPDDMTSMSQVDASWIIWVTVALCKAPYNDANNVF